MHPLYIYIYIYIGALRGPMRQTKVWRIGPLCEDREKYIYIYIYILCFQYIIYILQTPFLLYTPLSFYPSSLSSERERGEGRAIKSGN